MNLRRTSMVAPLALLLTASAVSAVSAQTTITLSAAKDATVIQKSAGDRANGIGRYFCVGNTNQGPDERTRRGIIAFDIAANLPAGATVTDVTLTLWMGKTQAGPTDVSLHVALADWGEGASEQNGCSGEAAAAGDATWLYTAFVPSDPLSSPAWGTPGGDYLGTASATISVDGEAYYSWTGSTLVSDIQMWLDLPGTDFGWFVVGNETGPETAKRFEAHESNQQSRRPVLEVTYITTATTGACCLPTGVCEVLTESDCTSQGGTYQGNGVPCSATLCVGACCFADGTCSELTASDCALQGGVPQGLGTTCTPGLCPVELTPYLDPLPIPAVALPVTGTAGGIATYEISMTEFTQQLHAQLPPTTVWGYGGTYPGPTIEATTGQPITVTWINDLRDEFGVLRSEHYLPVDLCPHGPNMNGNAPLTVVHLHGGHVPGESDGYPEDAYLPGSEDTFVYPNDQQAATIWYHDHGLGITRLNVYMGLAGYYIIRDAGEAALGLPSGTYEIPLVVQDRSFRPGGALEYPAAWEEHFFGDKILVNGKVWPSLDVDQGLYRFRMLNGSNSRVYRLALSNGAPFLQIGSDGGLLASPVPRPELILAPGERADVVVDFSGLPAGTEVLLENSAPAPFPDGTGNLVPDVMKFVVGSATGHMTPVPGSLATIETLQESDAVQFRDFELRKFADPCTGSHWLINGLAWDDITEFPVLGTTEVWSFINRSGIDHPMHMHLVFFQVLDRQPFEIQMGSIVTTGPPVPAPPEEQGWKDTVRARPFEITRVIARFEDYEGLFPYHCHILEHEDHEMMRQFQTIAPTEFVRGDANQDGQFDISDPVTCLLHTFGGVPVDCPRALDGNDDDSIDVADPVYLLAALFGGGPFPPAPHPGCGTDPTSTLPCTAFGGCP